MCESIDESQTYPRHSKPFHTSVRTSLTNDGAAACFTSNGGGSLPPTTAFLCGSRRCRQHKVIRPHQCHKVHLHLAKTNTCVFSGEHLGGAASDFVKRRKRCVPTSLRYALYLARQISRTTADALSRQHRDPSSSIHAPRNSALGFVFYLG